MKQTAAVVDGLQDCFSMMEHRLGAALRRVSTWCPEGFPTEVTLVGSLIAVHAQMQVKVAFLRESVATDITNKGTLVPVKHNTNR